MPMGTETTQGPLSGIRVIEFSGIGPIPHCGMMLSDLGAEVVTIDRPGGYGPRNDALERGRAVLTLDLHDAAEAKLAADGAVHADVLIEGYRPGVMERLGLGPEELCALNPRLIYGRLTGWGQDGTLAATVGHDINYLAITGALAALGRPGDPPSPPLNLVGDYGGGSMLLLVGILAALVEREKSGRGQVIDAAIVDGVSSMLAMFASVPIKREESVLGGAAPFYRTYECADGKFVALGAIEDKFWAAFVDRAGIGGDWPRYDASLWPEQSAELEALFRTKAASEWAALFEGSDACVTELVELSDAPAHPQLAARRTYAGGQPAPAPRLSRTPAAIRPRSDNGRAVIARWMDG